MSLDTIRHAASHWLARRRDKVLSTTDEHAFRAWRAEDPRHAEAYDAMARTLNELADLKELGDLEPVPRRRRAIAPWIGAAASAAAAALIASIILGNTLAIPTPLDPQRTEVAEVRQLQLSDGSAVTLGAATSIDVRFSESERRIVLHGGQAYFDVVHNEERPFFVEAGDTVIRDVGTKFDVDRADGRVRVSVVEGVVELTEPPSGLLMRRPDPVILRAGVRAEVPDTNKIAAGQSPTLSRAISPGSWRDGRFVYDDVRLGDLVADLNRYYKPGVKISDASLAELRLAASFRINELDTFWATLPQAAPITVEKNSDGSVRLLPHTAQ